MTLIRGIEILGKIFFLAVVVLLTLPKAHSEEETTDFVIIEKPDESIEYTGRSKDIRLGEPVVKKWAEYFAITYLKKDFTNVTDADDNVPSTFYGFQYGYALNMSYVSLSVDTGLYIGNKDGTLTDEATKTGLVDSLKNQVVVDLGMNLYVNLLEDYYLRPYVGGGIYLNQYKYLVEGSDTETKDYNINASFLRGGVLLDIGSIDYESGKALWTEFGISRTSLAIEMKKYNPVDSLNKSEFQTSVSFLFEY